MAKTFKTLHAVDVFEPGTEWTYKELQKQFGPVRIRQMREAGELVEVLGTPAADMESVLPSGARAAAAYDPTYDPESEEAGAEYARAMADEVTWKATRDAERKVADQRERRRLAALRRTEKRRAARGDTLTTSQTYVARAILKEGIACAAQVVEIMGGTATPVEVIRTSGVLSSLVERGVLFSTKVKGKAYYTVVDSWKSRI